MALAGLDQGQDLEALILRAKTTGEKRASVRFLDKQQLAGEEVLQMHQLGIPRDDGIGTLLEGEQDIHADAVLPSSADMAGFHDAARRPGNDHEPSMGNLLAKAHR